MKILSLPLLLHLQSQVLEVVKNLRAAEMMITPLHRCEICLENVILLLEIIIRKRLLYYAMVAYPILFELISSFV